MDENWMSARHVCRLWQSDFDIVLNPITIDAHTNRQPDIRNYGSRILNKMQMLMSMLPNDRRASICATT